MDCQSSLFHMTALDGSINRRGSGSAENKDRDLFIGRAAPDAFLALPLRSGLP